ncbi:MAG: glycosylase [Acidobacteria bacterium]|nr:glycosylase [Acidobacteriota bacterium]
MNRPSLLLALTLAAQAQTPRAVPPERMQAIYEEAKTPYKYGVVLEAPAGKKVDCPAVFRHGGKWYMAYVQLEQPPAVGYTTQLAESADLLHWTPLGAIVDRGGESAWDHANSGGGVALFDTAWGGGSGLQKHDGRYWISYLGGKSYGYEIVPLWIGLASTKDPSKPRPWTKLPTPVMTTADPDARPGLETVTLYKSFIFQDSTRTLGAPFVMFYNAKGTSEQIFTAVSQDLKTWKRYGPGPAVQNWPADGSRRGVITGDPQVVRMGDLWVMFYFGAFWKPGAFDTFAASYDLVHWTQWTGQDLIKPSEPWDSLYAHKPWLIKHNGVVYHFYCSVGGPKGEHRAIAVATSRDLKK